MSTPMESLETVISIAWILGALLTLAVPWIVGIRLEDSLTPPTRWLRILAPLSALALGVGIALRKFGKFDGDVVTVFGIPLLICIWLNAILRLSKSQQQQSPYDPRP